MHVWHRNETAAARDAILYINSGTVHIPTLAKPVPGIGQWALHMKGQLRNLGMHG